MSRVAGFIGGMFGFRASCDDFGEELRGSVRFSGAELARDVARGLAALGDGRRKTGLMRKYAPRSKWTEARRAKFMATVSAKYAKMRENTAKQLSDI